MRNGLHTHRNQKSRPPPAPPARPCSHATSASTSTRARTRDAAHTPCHLTALDAHAGPPTDCAGARAQRRMQRRWKKTPNLGPARHSRLRLRRAARSSPRAAQGATCGPPAAAPCPLPWARARRGPRARLQRSKSRALRSSPGRHSAHASGAWPPSTAPTSHRSRHDPPGKRLARRLPISSRRPLRTGRVRRRRCGCWCGLRA